MTTSAEEKAEAGRRAFRRGANEQARAAFSESLALAGSLGDRAAEAAALNGLARVALRDADYLELRKFADEAKAIAEELGDLPALSSAIHMLAAAARMEGDVDEARRRYDESIALREQLGDEVHVAGELHNLGVLERHEGRLSEADELARDALERARANASAYLIPYGLLDFGALAALRGDGLRAARLLAAAESALQETNAVFDPDEQPEFDDAVARTRALLGDDALTVAWQEGHALTLDAALDEALAR